MGQRSELTSAPREARAAIESHFTRTYEPVFGRVHARCGARVIDLLWRVSGGNLQEIRRRIERAVQDARSRGYGVDLSVVFCRWDRLGSRRGHARAA